MKKLTLLFGVLSFSFFLSCENNTDQDENLSSKISEINSNYQINSSLNGKTDPKKVKHLLGADALGALGFLNWATVPVVGPYITLWGTFGTSYYACSWCRYSTDIKSYYEDGKGDLFLNDLILNENLIINDNKNPHNLLGEMHNRLYIEIGINEKDLFTADNKFSEEGKDFILKNSSLNFTTSQKEDIINNIEIIIPEIISNVTTTSVNASGILSSNGTLSNTVITDAITIHDFIINSTIEGEILINYLIEIEDTILADDSLNSTDKDAMLKFIAVAKYSNAFWTTASNLK